jgi:hypothetical protein
VEEYFYFHRAALARCCAFDSSAAQSLRGTQPTSPTATVQTLRGVRMLEFCRADHIVEHFYFEVCTRKYSCLKIPLSQNTLAMLNPLNTTGAKRGLAIMSCVSLYSISERLLIESKMTRCETEHL